MTRPRFCLAFALVLPLVWGGTELEARKTDKPLTSARVHTVRSAETLSDIALRYRVSVPELKRWNRLADDRILIGQRLSIASPDKGGGKGSYVVRPGDSLSQIAARTGVSVTRLKRANGLVRDRIFTGQKLRLPAAGGSEPKPTRHTVHRGETLSEIALAYGVELASLRRLNAITGDRIAAGQRLALRAEPETVRPSSTRLAPSQRRPSAAEEEEDVLEYVVRIGDTLSEIAQRFDVSLGLLRQLNRLDKDRIFPGQKLRVRPSREDEGIHIVSRGETLSAIAVRYGLELSALREINGVEGDRILIGQKLRLRQASTAIHVVERGDALWEIARAYGMTVGELKELNGLASDRIYPGQELELNSEKAVHQLAAYTIVKGDNLSEIARLHQMTVAELKKLNHLRGSVIHPGQQLRVRPLLGRGDWLEQAEIRWADLQIAPAGLSRLEAGNGPYFMRRPKADQQKSKNYYEGHPASPLATYRQARKVWEGFERAVSGMGRLSDDLRGWHIVLDPGHGGSDPGAVGKTHDGRGNELFVVEDEYVYDMAMRVYVLLRLHGARVSMTLLSPNHLIRGSSPPALTFVNEKNEVYNSLELNKRNRTAQWPNGSRKGLAARVRIAREAFAGVPSHRCVFLSFHADIDPRAPEAPLVLYYESRDGRRRDNPSRQFAKSLLPALGAGARTRGQNLGVLRDNPAGVKALVEMRNLAYVDQAWALRFEQLRHRDAEKLVKGVLDYVRQRRLSARR